VGGQGQEEDNVIIRIHASPHPSRQTQTTVGPQCSNHFMRVRIKIAVRNLRKTSQERLLELNKKLYLVSIITEGFEYEGNGELDDEGDEQNDEEADDLDDTPEQMDTDKKAEEKSKDKPPAA
jgi:hypothetical protein